MKLVAEKHKWTFRLSNFALYTISTYSGGDYKIAPTQNPIDVEYATSLNDAKQILQNIEDHLK